MPRSVPPATILGQPAGVVYMVISAFSFSLMSLFVKVAGETLPPMQIVLARSVIVAVISYGLMKQADIYPWGRNKRLLVVRGLVGFVALSCFYYAVTLLPLADVTVIHYMNPVFTALLAAVFLGEVLKRSSVLALAFGVAGLLLVAQPQFLFGGLGTALDLAAVGIALTGAFFAASAYTIVRKLRESEAMLVVVFYFAFISTIAALPFLALGAAWPTLLEWGVLLAVGVTTHFGQVYLTKGLHAVQAGRAMSVSYVQIVFAALWGALFFGELPNLLTLAGGLLIVGAIFLVARGR